MKRCALMLLLVAGCSSPAADTLPMPGRLVQALTVVDDVQATARAVPRGGEAQTETPLVRGDDGVSFSGFIELQPGEYTLQVVFTGVPSAGGERLFLGRWTSDAFSVALGDTATPVFSEPLDVMGLAADDADGDADGLGNLDELLLGTDPAVADSDADGVVDGQDCRPTQQETEPFVIVSGGSALDCDGDGVRRPDVPFGAAGMDCNDQDASINPGAEDDCATPVDEDCNPATCSASDTQAPTVSAWTPADGQAVGCHAQVQATLQDEGGVTVATTVLLGADSGLDATLYMTADGDVFTSPPLNQVAGSDGLTPGSTTVRLEATDRAGNVLMQERQYDLQFNLPQITAMSPTSVGASSSAFVVTVEAQAALGLASIELHRVKKSGQGWYDVQRAERLGTAAQSPAQFTVDPTGLEDGEYLLFPVVRDAVGNEARPGAAIVPTPGLDGLEVTTDYRCIASSTPPKIPARVMVVGQQGGYAPATMRDLLPQALMEAAAVDPGTELVQIIALGLGSDGRVRLDDAGSFTRRWVFGFRHPTTGHNVSVTWLTPAFPGPNPTVDPDAGNITAEVPLSDVAALVDSDDVITAWQAQAVCPALTDGEDDQMLYLNQNGQDVVMVSSGGETWRATAAPSATELTDC